MSDFEDHLRKRLQNPEFAAAYEELRPEYEAIRAIIMSQIENITENKDNLKSDSDKKTGKE